MAFQTNWLKRRNTERIFLLLVTFVLAVLFFRLFTVLKKDFAEVPRRLAEGSMVNLNDDRPGERIKALLQKGFYFEDKRDIDLASSVISQRLNTTEATIDNIGELNKRKYDIDAEQAFAQGGDSYKKRVQLSRSLLGFTGADSLRFQQEKSNPPQLPSENKIALGKYNISGNIRGGNAAGVLVRLDMILPQDSIYSKSVTEVSSEATETAPGLRMLYAADATGNRQLQSMTAYTRTDAEGHFAFKGLPDHRAYEVIPLQPGFQFGPSKGMPQLDEDVSFTFYKSPHSVRLLSTRDFNNLKKERALIVRLPGDFSRWFQIIMVCFFAAFFLLHLLLTIYFHKADQLILPAVMLLTGISFLTLLSLQDPLSDRFLAKDTLGYFAIGFVGLSLLLFFNLRRFTVDSGLYRLFIFKNNPTAANGWPWAALALLLLALTILFGTGPEGSGVKVNLFGFQPSELVKFLILLFLAGFFAMNEKFISEYATWQKRWSFFSFALVAIVTTILMFLILGDLGPAIVACFTFIILFSFSRGDFSFMAGAVVLYTLAAWIIQNVWIATGITALALVLAGYVTKKKDFSESALMALIVIAAFLLLDQVSFLDDIFPGPMQRLVDRKAIWLDAWNNEVFGGDQVANGIWAMASGGIKGQGIGEGFAKTIPEAHTDMILPSIGEELGWAGIVCIFILFVIYLHRAIIIGRQTGTPFLFYLCAGIGVSTFVQFLLIAGGSTGALPLSGISLPFISYGGSSLVINLLAAGLLLSASNVTGTAVQMNYITRQQDKNLVPALVAAFVGVLLLTVNVSRYLFRNERWVVQPALVAERSGARMFSYNPRIAILMNRLQAGNLYDRKGKILATSKPEMVRQQRDSLLANGIDPLYLDALVHRRQDRYYPFAEQMFFWTGDVNTGVFTGGINGYFAEYEHAAELRGFPAPVVNYAVMASRFRESRFLPETAREMTVSKRDFSAIAPLLLAGINSKEVDAFKKRNRDVQLTIDASLQTALQRSLGADPTLKDNRVSVVVMEDSTGEVLASACYPLPPVDNWDQLTLPPAEQTKLGYWLTTRDLGFTHATQPGSTAKIATALAAFNKLGVSAAQKTFIIRQQDLIRVRSDEPDETGTISMERAIVKSNNPYFIRLANEMELQEQMATLYLQTGMFLRGVGGYFYESDPDVLYQQNKWRELWRNTEFRSLKAYDRNDIRATRGRGVSGMAWGQGELVATPASMARLVSGVANHGFMIQNRFVLKIADSVITKKDTVMLAKDPAYAQILTGFMKKQSAGKVAKLGILIAGKTGTPERIIRKRRINDGWYTFFAPKAKGPGHIVVCIRIEDCKGSSEAVKLAGEHVIPRLLAMGYIKGFETTSP
ncbi:FtsW/RodA/SpoVE family cell cycle protein [Chitinophagaceae bacterium LB-8]|uniref:FtsW/RodA/SpoVE family cell cycle protein n=1 Tax=Paraflavisolibacter caeni TaxID=2982496 RepID=A0A9X3B9I1_9BACT|nr:FtsW/RodA/SpoVE family cell cycle protein [Paraflavisolibacter caeni]MCU7552035.1 FtsW/RodA/SpoVE family cell cycle protein [Paraflavisolibacter caeni]